jgi:serine/threonine-protein kinase PpkA
MTDEAQTVPAVEIPGYEIKAILGEGGMATVYLAEQVSLNRAVALKVMSFSLIQADREFCDRFIKEGKIIAKLHHRNIVTIYDIGRTDDDNYYMSMECCLGGTLKARIADGQGPALAVSVISQVAAALGYAHGHGFVHRDIKPGNILFREGDDVVLSDFGVAKTIDERTRFSGEGWAVGTPEYMSPEQSTGGDVSPASDLYSLGVVLFEMLSGRKPFTGPDALAVAMQHLNNPVPDLPPEQARFQPVINRLLAKLPADRYASAEALIDDLGELDDAVQPVSARSRPRSGMDRRRGKGGARASAPAVKSRARTPRWSILAGGVGVVTAAAGIAAWLALSEPTPHPLERSEQGGADADPVPDNGSRMSQETAARVERLLAVARAHKAIGRLREPIGSNAYEAYGMVLELDPDNAEATEALREIEAQTAAR